MGDKDNNQFRAYLSRCDCCSQTLVLPSLFSLAQYGRKLIKGKYRKGDGEIRINENGRRGVHPVLWILLGLLEILDLPELF